MPLYSFECKNGHSFDEVYSIAERDTRTKCPTCKKQAKRVISSRQTAPGFTDKLYSSGNGYYDVGLGQVFHTPKERSDFMKREGFFHKGSEQSMSRKQERFLYSYRMSNNPRI